MSKKPLTYLSLFSGSGVGCYGFKEAGFECVATVELIERRLDVQRYNKKCRYESGYISGDISLESTKEKLLSELGLWEKEHGIELDVLISTPPCQGMSVANHKKRDELRRNSLVVESIKLVDQIRPKVFLFENVRAFLTTACTDLDGHERTIREAIELTLGGSYYIFAKVINFKDYGSNSSRTRTLVIGTRKDQRDITPLDLFPEPEKARRLREVIGELPRLTEMGQIAPDDIFHNFRPYPEHMRAWISETLEGQSAFANKNPNHRPHKVVDGKIVFNQNKNGDKYRRCYWDQVAPCIHTRNDILASQSTVHPVDDRVFSVRELMRLMTIPETYRWLEMPESNLNALPETKKRELLSREETNIRQCIGEGVPTAIFRKIAQKVKESLQENIIQDKEARALIANEGLEDPKKMCSFIIKNANGLSFYSLAKLAELSNSARTSNAAYYTRQDICFSLVNSLPYGVRGKKIRILEPSVGVGNFLPLLFKKYTENEVTLDVADVDAESIKLLQVLLSKLTVPNNFKINFIVDDFLLRDFSEDYDVIVGNPPFGKITKNPQLLKQYKANKHNKDTNNIASFFLEKSLRLGRYVALIMPKSMLSSPEFNLTRTVVTRKRIEKVSDFGESAFPGVKIETIALCIDNRTPRQNQLTLIESFPLEVSLKKDQTYFTDSQFPSWLLYRNQAFDSIAGRLRLGMFSRFFRDRQISKKHTGLYGEVRVLKSRNIGPNRIIDIPNYDVYLASSEKFGALKYLNRDKIVLVPNLSYYPRAAFLPKGSIADGSVALLETDVELEEKDLEYFSSREFFIFYRIARNYGTRSLNIDANSVFYWGLPITRLEYRQFSPSSAELLVKA